MGKLIDRIILYFEEITLCILFAVMPLVCIFQVLCRYAFHFPAPWTEELMRALFVWATFIGASLGVKYGAHLGVTAIVNLFPPRFRSAFQALIFLLCAGFCLFFTYSGYTMVAHQTTMNQLLPVTRLPVGLTTACLPVGFGLMTIRMLLRTWDSLQEALHPDLAPKEGV
ncbi:MAG: TRAP transporter small permease [Gracilibacteraceae bacterium]|jgi:C4-dicarboxylate transporter DctQ subunit|nr:TRAP transporter small permease [Gracilibacteraceae bacterium]